MKIKRITAAVGVVAAGAVFTISTQGSAQAASTPPSSALKAPIQKIALTGETEGSHLAQTDWHPPAGYVLEDTFTMATNAYCRKKGDQGIAKGKWQRYVCHETMVKIADAWVTAQYLYVKK